MSNAATVLVTGNTFPVKDALKALGGRWDAANKGWRVPAVKAADAQALVSGKPMTFAGRGVVRMPPAVRGPFGRCMSGDEDGDGGCSCGRPGCHD